MLKSSYLDPVLIDRDEVAGALNMTARALTDQHRFTADEAAGLAQAIRDLTIALDIIDRSSR